MKKDSEMTSMVELIDKMINSVITIFHIFKKVKERLSILTRDLEDVKKTHGSF